jgi:hypothetical protein
MASDDDLGFAPLSTEVYNAWLAARRPAELHAYAQGGHGFAMLQRGLPVDTWPERFEEWLRFGRRFKCGADPATTTPSDRRAVSVPWDRRMLLLSYAFKERCRTMGGESTASLARVPCPVVGTKTKGEKIDHLKVMIKSNREPDHPPDRDESDEAPETPPTQPPPVPVKEPPEAPDERGPYVVENRSGLGLNGAV